MGVVELKEIRFKVIPHSDQRYPTAGDYYETADTWEFRVSTLENSDYEFLVFLHEIVEWYLTQKRGIKEPDIAAFDIAFEQEIQEGKQPPDAEPGNDPRAPYYREHQFATKVEKLMGEELGVDWEGYNNAVISLFDTAAD